MISLLCPTRGRPEQYKRMCESAKETAIRDINIIAYVDDDDPKRDEYPQDVIIGPRLALAPAYQYLYEHSTAPIVMMCADDIVFRTKGWDAEVEEKAPKDGIFVISYDDLGRPRKEDGHPFIGRRFIEIMGYFTYPKLSHSCVDNWVVDIAKKINRYIYSDIIIEHMHPKYLKGEIDSTYLENSKPIKQADGAIYLGPEGQKEIAKVVERMKGVLSDPMVPWF